MQNRFVFGNARFTVVDEGVIRMEYANDGQFIDEKTLFAVNREHNGTPFTTEDTGESFTIRTARLVLTYDYGKNEGFTADTLRASILRDGKLYDVWFAGKKNVDNLGGTLPTLDAIPGSTAVEEGIVSRAGWYLLDDSGTPILKDQWITDRGEEHVADWYLFSYGQDFPLALRQLALVSGKMAMPRRVAFGSWYSRWHPYTAEDFINIVDEYDQHDFPLDILVMDMDWHWSRWRFVDKPDDPHKAKTGFGWGGGDMNWTGYSWCTDLIPDPDALLNEMKRRHITVTLNDHPADGIRECEDCYDDFMTALGYDPKDGINLPFAAGDKKYMTAFFEQGHRPIEDQGVDFWWVDWQQNSIIPTVSGMKDLLHLPWLNYLYYHNSRRNGKRGISYSRWGGFGDHKHPLYFSGDIFATWDALRYEIYFTSTAANAGCFYWAHDTGGFCGERDPELYVRWVQFSLTTAALRLHSTGDEMDRRPWKWGDRECDAIRDMFHLRSQLMPYLYSTAYQAYEQSKAPLRPIYYDYPNWQFAYACPEEYFFGDAFLCAPICAPGIGDDHHGERQVRLVGGEYYDFFTGEQAPGDCFIAKCPLERFPLYIKAGMPVPMQPYERRMTAKNPETLIVKAYPTSGACDNHFRLFEDDGISENYQNGEGLVTELGYRREENGAVTVSAVPQGTAYDGMPAVRTYRFELEATDAAVEVVSASHKATVAYDADRRCNVVTVADVDAWDAVTVCVK